MLKRCAVKLSKICNDLRLLSSGPRAGFGEINLPPMQPGSSIMPGKVNPVIPEVVNQVCFDVIGGDVTVTMAAEAGQLQLNVFEPVIAYRLLAGIDTLDERAASCCASGASPGSPRTRSGCGSSSSIPSASSLRSCRCSATRRRRSRRRRWTSGRGVYELVLARGLMTREELDRALESRDDDGSSPRVASDRRR